MSSLGTSAVEDPAISKIPNRTGVVGGGTMGSGIAHALLLAGSSVVLLERDPGAAAQAKARVNSALEGSVRRGVIDATDEAASRLTATTRIQDLASAALVVEAVPEILDIKLETLRAIEDVVAPDAVIGTNTSSMSIDLLAQSLARPQRLIGLHFFNPVPASKLVEVVRGAATDPTLPDTAASWVRELGKTPVVVRDAPGFASSRLGVAIGLEAIRMLQEGVASAEDIDAAMTLGYGHPMGPLRLTDLVGLDVRLGIARYLEQELGPRFAAPDLMVTMVEQGNLGRKSGRGFYTWDETS
jgi:3-hydroxybutyryl-CoA dehydrogenase